jgi:hypothetical protein
MKIKEASAASVLWSTTLFAMPAYQVAHKYEVPLDASGFIIVSLSADGTAFGLSNTVRAEYSILRFGPAGHLAWRFDLGATRPLFGPEGITDSGFFYGAYRRDSLGPTGNAIDAATFVEGQGLKVFEPLDGQRLAYLRASSQDGRWVAGDVYYQDGTSEYVVWTPERVAVPIGRFQVTGFSADGNAIGGWNGRSATWSLNDGPRYLPEPPSHFDYTLPSLLTGTGLMYVEGVNDVGNGFYSTRA